MQEPEPELELQQSEQANKLLNGEAGSMSARANNLSISDGGVAGTGAGLLQLSPPDCLQFRPGPGGQLTACLTITASKPAAFKLKTTKPDWFRVRPSRGAAQPGAGCGVEVLLLAGAEHLQTQKFLLRHRIFTLMAASHNFKT